MLGTPELDTGFRVGFQGGAESPPSPAANTALDAVQDTSGFLGCKCTLPGHIELFIHNSLKFSSGLVLIHSLPSLCLGLPWPCCRILHLALLNFMRVAQTQLSSLSRSCWMVSIPSSVSTTPHIKLAEGSLSPTFCVTDKDIKKWQLLAWTSLSISTSAQTTFPMCFSQLPSHPNSLQHEYLDIGGTLCY